MSFAVVRGAPTPAQRHVDGVLAAAAAAPRAPHAPPLSMPQIMHYCMRTRPDRVFMTNGATGARITNRSLLSLSVPLARALAARGYAAGTALVAARDHERTLATYLALLFAGVVPFMADPTSTQFELQYYLDLVEPRVIFCDASMLETARATVAGASADTLVVAIHTDELLEFAEGFGDNIDEYRVCDAEANATLLLLPTSGSTGLPKAARYHHDALVQQLAEPWRYYDKFPTPTERVMILTTPQWATFTMMVTSCCVFDVELLMSPEMPTVDHVLHIMETYKPTWTFLGPAFAKALAAAGEARHFASVETVHTLGSHATPDIAAAMKEKFPRTCHVSDCYGMTEAHGVIALPARGAPPGCNGVVNNILHYKLVKDDGTIAGVGEDGELYIKGDCIIKGYHKNPSELESSLADGWLRTGDEFSADADARLYYRRRIKFSFKYNNLLVCPEEVEGLLDSLPFVAEVVVSASARGPAAAVVLRAPAPPEQEVRKTIHELVESTLSEHKRLRGGVALVAALPRTHTGKLQRHRCKEMIDALIEDGLCC